VSAVASITNWHGQGFANVLHSQPCYYLQMTKLSIVLSLSTYSPLFHTW